MTKSYEQAQREYFDAEGIDPISAWHPIRASDRVIRTHVLELGASGPPVVLVHGGGGLAAAWAPLMAKLPGYRLIAPDRPGGGLSDGFDYRGVDLREHAVSWLSGVFDVYELDSAVVVANSMGARWATWFALEQPTRVAAIAALGVPAALLDTSAPVPMRLLGIRGIGNLMMALEKPSPSQAASLWKRMGHPPEMASETLTALTIALGEQPSYPGTWRSLLGNCLRLSGMAPWMPIDPPQLNALEMPLVLGFGDSDPFGSLEVGRRAAALAPQGSFHQVGTGHLPWLDDPAGCAALLLELLQDVYSLKRSA